MADTSEAGGSSAENLTLGTLRPVYDEDKHGLYVDLLVRDITSASPSHNIAVSGAYGSGKSSVLEGLQSKLEAKPVAIMQVSLATLNQSRKALLEVSGEPTLTAALEKEVVKRLLYSAKPAQIPRSRFKRIVGFRPKPAAGIAIIAGLLVAGAAATFGRTLPMEQIVTTWHWKHWLGPVLDVASVAVLVFFGQAAMSTFRLRQVGIGPATLALDDQDTNDFDRYLDEIVYFFEKTKTRVVVFEDLDRFNDAGIFLALRELNNLLNSSGQISQEVTFVYAIRDSLFAQAIDADEADDWEPDETDESTRPEQTIDGLALPDAHARHGVDSAASDRAKFFDLIVPIVPFISHEVAADLLVTALRDLPDEFQPSRALATLAGSHFADMRVIHSIRNEYEVFAAELLKKSPVRGLAADQLFAMILYKHLHLDDFERIRIGESKLDAAVDRIREAVADMIEAVDKAIAALEDAIHTGRSIDRRAKAAGDRLLALLDAILRLQNWGPAQTLTIDAAKQFARDQVPTRDFWIALAENDQPALQVQSPNGPISIAAADLPTLLGSDRSPKKWTRSETQADRQRLGQLNEARDWVRQATFADLLAGPYPSVDLDETHSWTTARDQCAEELGDGLPLELLRHGYIDQNFSLYTTKFHGAILSADARTYLLQYIDRHRADPHFFLSADDADELLSRRGDSLLADESSLNLFIVDRLLETRADRLPAALEKSGSAEDFLVTYLADGRHGDRLLTRLAGIRGDILDVVSAATRLSEEDRRTALNTCLSALSRDISFAASPTTVAVLADALDTMPALEAELEPSTASAIAELMSSKDLAVGDLARVHEPLRSAIADAGGFAVTPANLDAITQAPGAVGLDTIGDISEGARSHLIANLSDYLAAINANRAGSIVDDPAKFDLVVRAIIEGAPDDLAAALAYRPPAATYADLSLAPSQAYGELAQAGAFTVTRENVSQYIDVVGSVDASLASLLDKARAIEVNEDDVQQLEDDQGEEQHEQDAADVEQEAGHDAEEEAARRSLATTIVNSDQLLSDAKIQLVVSLNTTTTLDVDDLNLSDPELTAGLLREGEIADEPATFTSLASAPWKVFEAAAGASTNVASFIDQMPFTDELLSRVLMSGTVGQDAKTALLSRFDAIDGALGAQSAEAWLAASAHTRVSVTPAQLARLAQAGAPTAKVLAYVERAKPPLTSAELVAIFAHCDQPYAGLATPNGAKFTVPFSTSFRPILSTLRDGGVVKGFHKKRGRDRDVVQMAG